MRARGKGWVLWLACLWLAAGAARADDVADEADVEFNLGAERYERQDYAAALSHFLASNRLAMNRNVLFNIALTYEKLAHLPEAYRYYARSLEGETDAASVSRIRAALARLAPRVPLLHIVTEPPGAHLYLDRRDLGERGTAPQTMALAAGSHQVFAELEGYRLAQSEPLELRAGAEQTGVAAARADRRHRPSLGLGWCGRAPGSRRLGRVLPGAVRHPRGSRPAHVDRFEAGVPHRARTDHRRGRPGGVAGAGSAAGERLAGGDGR